MASKYDNWKEGDCGVDAREEARQERIEKLLANDDWLAKYTPTADEYADGMMDGVWYSNAQAKLADLADMPADKIRGSDLQATLIRLGVQAKEQRYAQLRHLAEQQIERDDNHAPDMAVAA